jgi:hypothetical protein
MYACREVGVISEYDNRPQNAVWAKDGQMDGVEHERLSQHMPGMANKGTVSQSLDVQFWRQAPDDLLYDLLRKLRVSRNRGYGLFLARRRREGRLVLIQ